MYYLLAEKLLPPLLGQRRLAFGLKVAPVCKHRGLGAELRDGGEEPREGEEPWRCLSSALGCYSALFTVVQWRDSSRQLPMWKVIEPTVRTLRELQMFLPRQDKNKKKKEKERSRAPFGESLHGGCSSRICPLEAELHGSARQRPLEPRRSICCFCFRRR